MSKSRQFVVVKNKSMSVFHVSVRCYWQWISSKHCQSSLQIHFTIISWIHTYFDNVMTKFMINNRTDAWKTVVNLLNLWGVDSGRHSFCVLCTYCLGTRVAEASEYFQVGKTPDCQRRQECRCKLSGWILLMIPLNNLLFWLPLSLMLVDALCSVSLSVGFLVLVWSITFLFGVLLPYPLANAYPKKDSDEIKIQFSQWASTFQFLVASIKFSFPNRCTMFMCYQLQYSLRYCV